LQQKEWALGLFDTNEELMDSIESYEEVVSPTNKNVREYYKDKPVELAWDMFGLTFPAKPVPTSGPGLRELVEDVCTLKVFRAAVQAPRGGGKSLGFSYIEWFMNFIRNFDWLNLGGSEYQARAVYKYMTQYINSSDEFKKFYGEVLRSYTENKDGAWISVLAASSTSTRSPHAGGIIIKKRKGEEIAMGGRGGGLTIDEECEADEEIVKSAIPTVNTADPSVIMRGSTFHRLDGTFKTLVDNCGDMGYKLYKWDCFDICKACTYDCSTCYKDFREDIYEKDELVHEAYCGGKAKLSAGWMNVEEIFQAWKECLFDRDWFEVEMMGLRPSSAGHVVKNMTKFNKVCVVPDLPPASGHCTITIDWGLRGECCVQVWQEQPLAICALLEDEHYTHQESETFIYEVVRGFGRMYHTNMVAADSSHPYCNATLANDVRYRMQVKEVNFQTEKDLAAGALNAKVDMGLVRIPMRHIVTIKQMRNWRKEHGKIKKGNDHGCDAALCFFSKFRPEDMIRQQVRIVPQPIKVA
jgi:hypothetical protein